MAFPVVLPDIEALLVAYLNSELATRPELYASGVHVSTLLPDPRPDRAVTVRDDGGGRPGDVRGHCQVGVNVWGASDGEAMDLGNLVSALIVGCVGHGPVREATATRPMRILDESGQPRVYLTAQLTVRGTSL